jgi:hypothetical protein
MYVCCFIFVGFFGCCVLKKKEKKRKENQPKPTARPSPSSLLPRGPPQPLLSIPSAAQRSLSAHKRPTSAPPSPLSPSRRQVGPTRQGRLQPPAARLSLLAAAGRRPRPPLPLPASFPLPSTELRVNAQCPAHEPPRPFPSRHAAPSPTTIHGGRRCARAPTAMPSSPLPPLPYKRIPSSPSTPRATPPPFSTCAAPPPPEHRPPPEPPPRSPLLAPFPPFRASR